MFGTLTAQIVIDERHEDTAQVTSHPVQATANISDHIIILPTRLAIRMGWTSYGLQSLGTYEQEAISGGGIPTPNNIRQIYNTVLGMFRNRVPFTITTGKRQLQNMVITALREETTERTENCLILTVYCEQVFLVQTTYTAVPGNNVQADASASGSPVAVGTQQIKPSTISMTSAEAL